MSTCAKSENIIAFIEMIGVLKNTYRFEDKKKSKKRKKTKDTVADHLCRAIIMAITLAEELNLEINRYHAIKIVATHDLGEYLDGDIDRRRVYCGEISKEEKKERERHAILKLRDELSSDFGNHLLELWNEFEEAQTQEAKFAVAVDKLETMKQIVENGYKTYNKPEIIPNYADPAVSEFPQLFPMLLIIKEELKQEFVKGKIPWIETYDTLIVAMMGEQRQERKH